MPSRLQNLAALLACPHCLGPDWAEDDDVVRCRTCGQAYQSLDGVLDLTTAYDDPILERERGAARLTERDPELGGINERFGDLAAVDGPLKSAIVTLPHGDGSRYYREPGYFANVHSSVAAFEFLLRHLEPVAGERLLDLGADLTWSTAQLARRGLHCTAVDINHHLRVARLFFEHYGIAYDLVRADMRRVSFRDATFDVVLAVNALHHNADIGEVAANAARVLRPGGRLAFIEPYCSSEEEKARFGAAQIDAGINEHVYTLPEWHFAFTRAGLTLKVHRICDSFAAIYRKDAAAQSEAPGLDQQELFSGFYDAQVTLASPAGSSEPGPLVRIRNAGNGTWCPSSLFPVRVSYHLYRTAQDSRTLVSFDNPRTPLVSALEPGEETTIRLDMAAPDRPGRYVAEVDLVHEGVRWFSERGLQPVALTFDVPPA